MFKTLSHKLAGTWEKNRPDIQSAVTRRLPRFFYAAADDLLMNDIPVFVFHSVTASGFEKQMQYLAENGYKTLDADQLFEKLKDGGKHEGRRVALTFDDALGSFWSVAYPLLEKYGFSAILFVAPGLIPDDDCFYPVLGTGEAASREQLQPLCTWPELIAMHQSGIVDIQSHSLTHSRINISANVVDFLSPGFGKYILKHLDIPVRRDESPLAPVRNLRPGQPLYQSASRLNGRLRFLEDPRIDEALIEYISGVGENVFFMQKNWRSILFKKHNEFVQKHGMQASYETAEQMGKAVFQEFFLSKQMLESKLPGKQVRHFCYPWFQGAPMSDQIAKQCGYRSVHYGMDPVYAAKKTDMTMPVRIRRVSEEYLHCLPGKGRASIGSVWARKLTGFAGKTSKQVFSSAF